MGQRSAAVVSVAVAGYGVSMVFVPSLVGGLFEALGLGMRGVGITGGPARSYVLFLYGVLGAVIVGWMVLVAAVATGRSSTGTPWAWRALTVSVSVWFVLDSGLSLVMGEWQHALFNLAFLAALGLPLLLWWRTEPGSAAPALSDSR